MNESLSRAFMYGESVFTTLRMKNGTLCDWDHHFERLRLGLEFVYGPFTEGGEWRLLMRDRLEDLLASASGDKVLRVTVHREQVRGLTNRAGLTSTQDLKLHLSQSPYDPSVGERSVALRTCAGTMRPKWWPSYLKSGDYLATILSQKVHLLPGDDDLLFLSPSDTVLGSSVANVFVARHDRLYTPPAGPSVLQGVMRRKVLESGHKFFEEVSEVETTLEQLRRADFVFGTNSVRGPFLIHSVDDQAFTLSPRDRERFEALKAMVMA